MGRYLLSSNIWNDGKNMSEISLKIKIKPRMGEGATAETWGAWGRAGAVDVLGLPD